MKDIDPKSLIIGVLATALVFACTDSNKKNSNSSSLVSEAKAATGPTDKWDNQQEWIIATAKELGWYDLNGKPAPILKRDYYLGKLNGGEDLKLSHVRDGWEPFAENLFRKRIK